MKAQDLRIGNYVLFNNGKETGQITSVESYVTGQYKIGLNNRIDIKYYCDEVKPIPLTEEWLLKFGFAKSITQDIHPTFCRSIVQWNDGIIYVSKLGFLNHIKHVHQLQNLYFALTNKELTI